MLFAQAFSALTTSEHGLITHLQFLTESPIGDFFAVFAARWCVFLLVAWVIWSERTTKDSVTRHAMREAGWSGMFALLLALCLSSMIERDRPFFVLSDVHMLIPMPLSQYSFPSAHTSFAFGVAFACLWGARRAREILIPMMLAATVALGRVLVGVHYPSDVFAGLCLGGFAFAVVRTMHHLVRHIPKRV